MHYFRKECWHFKVFFACLKQYTNVIGCTSITSPPLLWVVDFKPQNAFLQLVWMRKYFFHLNHTLGMTRCKWIYLILWINMMQLDILPFNMEGQPTADNNTRKRARRFCDHCNENVSHAHFYHHKKKFFFVKGAWIKAATNHNTELEDSEMWTGMKLVFPWVSYTM